MIKILFKYYFLLFLIILYAQPGKLYAQDFSKQPLRIIVSSSMIQNAKPQDIEASTRILAAEMNKESMLQAKVDIVVCENDQELNENIKTDFDLLYISPTEYLKLKSKLNIEPYLISEIDNNYGDVFYLITYKSENKLSLKELKDGSIDILTNAEDQVPTLWLDKLLRDNGLPSKSKFFKQVTLDNKTNNVLLSVFFKKATAAIVPKSAYDVICELNPKIRKDTKIILESDPLVRAFFCYDGRKKDEERKKFLFEYLQTLHQNNYGKQVLSIYMVNRLIPFKTEYLKNILELYK